MALTPLDATSAPYALARLYDAPDFHAGCAEPWIAEVLCALVLANHARVVLEVGGFEGFTSKRLMRTLARIPDETLLTVCEIDSARAEAVDRVLFAEHAEIVKQYRPSKRYHVICADSHHWIPTLADASLDFVWLEGNHEAHHVAREIELLLPKLAPGALLCGHDVFGVCDLRYVFRHFGGYALDLLRLGPAGGIGVIQKPR